MTPESSSEREVTVTLSERDLHALCNAADHVAWVYKSRDEQAEMVAVIGRVTEALRVAWVEQVTA